MLANASGPSERHLQLCSLSRVPHPVSQESRKLRLQNLPGLGPAPTSPATRMVAKPPNSPPPSILLLLKYFLRVETTGSLQNINQIMPPLSSTPSHGQSHTSRPLICSLVHRSYHLTCRCCSVSISGVNNRINRRTFFFLFKKCTRKARLMGRICGQRPHSDPTLSHESVLLLPCMGHRTYHCALAFLV